MAREFHRSARVSSLLRKEIGLLVHQQVREHGLPSASVSDVEVARDLSHAKVYVTALSPDQSATVVETLNALAGEFRRQLGRQLHMRTIPALRFHYDRSVDQGERIESLLRNLPRGAEPDEDPGPAGR